MISHSPFLSKLGRGAKLNAIAISISLLYIDTVGGIAGAGGRAFGGWSVRVDVMDMVGSIDGACGGTYDEVPVGDDVTDTVGGIGGVLGGEAATGT